MFTYSQDSGVFTDGVFLAFGIAGNGDGLNNPEMENVQFVGPLPKGNYFIGKAFDHPKLGVNTFILTPAPTNQMYGRSAFFIHALEFTATLLQPGRSSDGCICLEHDDRARLAMLVSGGDQTLEVIE